MRWRTKGTRRARIRCARLRPARGARGMSGRVEIHVVDVIRSTGWISERGCVRLRTKGTGECRELDTAATCMTRSATSDVIRSTRDLQPGLCAARMKGTGSVGCSMRTAPAGRGVQVCSAATCTTRSWHVGRVEIHVVDVVRFTGWISERGWVRLRTKGTGEFRELDADRTRRSWGSGVLGCGLHEALVPCWVESRSTWWTWPGPPGGFRSGVVCACERRGPGSSGSSMRTAPAGRSSGAPRPRPARRARDRLGRIEIHVVNAIRSTRWISPRVRVRARTKGTGERRVPSKRACSANRSGGPWR